jgi:hypothetical protein
VQSLGDYIRNFGPPIAGGYLGQSVFQFFGNGGSDCYVVRLAKSSQSAGLTLQDSNQDNVLVVTAVSQGLWGNSILLTVDYNTARPDSTFNVNVSYTSQGSLVKTESLGNLSMDPSSPRYARFHHTVLATDYGCGTRGSAQHLNHHRYQPSPSAHLCGQPGCHSSSLGRYIPICHGGLYDRRWKWNTGSGHA